MRIPLYTREVMPDNSQPQSIELARTQNDIDGRAALQRGNINAQNIDNAQQERNRGLDVIHDYQMRELEAKNTTAVNESTIRYKREVAETLDQMRAGRAGNPEQFAKDFDDEMQKREQNYYQSAPSELAAAAMREGFSQSRASVYESNLGWEREAKAQNYASSLERAADDLNVLAFRAGKSGGGNIDDLLQNVEASTIAGATIVAPDKVANIRDTMRRGVITSMIEGLATTNPYEAKKRLGSKIYDADLKAEDLQRLEKVATAEIDRRKAEARADFNQDFGDFQSAMKLGLKIDPEVMGKQAARAAALGMPKQAEAIREYVQIQDRVQEYAVKPLVVQQEELVTMRDLIEAGDVSQVKEYAAKVDVLKVKVESLKKDPFQFYAAHEKIAEPKPINFNDPQQMAAEIQTRRGNAQMIKDNDGVDVNLFTPAEVDGMKKIFETASPADSGQLFAALGMQLQKPEVEALARAVNDKSPVLAAAIANGDPQVSEAILAGTRTKGEVSAGDVRELVRPVIENAIADPEKLEAAHAAVYAYYKTRALQKSEPGLDDDLVKESINKVLGPVIKLPGSWNGKGSHILSYRGVDKNWVDEDEIDDILYSLTDEQLLELNQQMPGPPNGLGGGRPYTAESIMNAAKYTTVGDGIYRVDVDGLGYLTYGSGPKNGQPYTIDARALQEIQKKAPGRKQARTPVTPGQVRIGK